MPTKLLKSFLSVLITLHLIFFSLLNEPNLKETKLIFFRQQIWVFASDLMYDFCLDVNKEHTAVCYRILNKHFGADRIFRLSSCYRSDRELIFLVFLK